MYAELEDTLGYIDGFENSEEYLESNIPICYLFTFQKRG